MIYFLITELQFVHEAWFLLCLPWQSAKIRLKQCFKSAPFCPTELRAHDLFFRYRANIHPEAWFLLCLPWQSAKIRMKQCFKSAPFCPTELRAHDLFFRYRANIRPEAWFLLCLPWQSAKIRMKRCFINAPFCPSLAGRNSGVELARHNAPELPHGATGA